jgi:hypothetical protein
MTNRESKSEMMKYDKDHDRGKKFSEVQTGNASNPAPHDTNMEPVENNQLLGKKAETYLRESGNIEDLPDAQQQLDADETIREENDSQ